MSAEPSSQSRSDIEADPVGTAFHKARTVGASLKAFAYLPDTAPVASTHGPLAGVAVGVKDNRIIARLVRTGRKWSHLRFPDRKKLEVTF